MCCSNHRRNACIRSSGGSTAVAVGTQLYHKYHSHRASPSSSNTFNPREIIYTPATTPSHSSTAEAFLSEAANTEILHRAGMDPPSYDVATKSDSGTAAAMVAPRAVIMNAEDRGVLTRLSESTSSSSGSSSSVASGSWMADKAWRKLEKKAWKAARKAERAERKGRQWR